MRARLVTAAGGALALAVALGACSENTGRQRRRPRHRPGPHRRHRHRPEGLDGPGGGGAGRDQGRHVQHPAGEQDLPPGPAAGLLVRRPDRHASSTPVRSPPSRTTARATSPWSATSPRRPARTSTSDCKVWEFKIKDGVKFEDGRRSPARRSRTASPARSTPTSPAAPPTCRSGWPTPPSSTPPGTSPRAPTPCRRD